MDPAAFDLLGLTTVIAGVLGTLNDEIDERIQLDEALTAHIKKYATVSQQDGTHSGKPELTVSALDVYRFGNHIYRGAAAFKDWSAFLASLPDIGLESTRIIFYDIPTLKQYWPGHDFTDLGVRTLSGDVRRLGRLKNRGRGDKTLLGNLTYDSGQRIPQPTFQDVQRRIFDVWDLENLWRPSSTGPHYEFYVQANVLESLLETSDTLEKSRYISRQVLFFGQHAIEYWESMASVKTKFLSDGRAESKRTVLACVKDFVTKCQSVTCKFPALLMKFIDGDHE
ncbi:hypothetical protein MMC27_002066 [Xylographa pallens]|nr:hypothetical protein [Xylographa pallens]